MAVFIFQHNCFFSYTSFFSLLPQRDYSFKTTCCKNLVEEITTVYDMQQLNRRIRTLFWRHLGQLINPLLLAFKDEQTRQQHWQCVWEGKTKVELTNLKVMQELQSKKSLQFICSNIVGLGYKGCWHINCVPYNSKVFCLTAFRTWNFHSSDLLLIRMQKVKFLYKKECIMQNLKKIKLANLPYWSHWSIRLSFCIMQISWMHNTHKRMRDARLLPSYHLPV